MSSTLLSQIDTPAVNKEAKSSLRNTLSDLGAMLTMYAVTATAVLLMSLTWVF